MVSEIDVILWLWILVVILFCWSIVVGSYYLVYFICDSALWTQVRNSFKGIRNRNHIDFAKLQFFRARAHPKVGGVYHSFVIPDGHETYTVYDIRNTFWCWPGYPFLNQTLVVSKVRPNANDFVLTHHHFRYQAYFYQFKRYFADEPTSWLKKVGEFRPKSYPRWNKPASIKLFARNADLKTSTGSKMGLNQTCLSKHFRRFGLNSGAMCYFVSCR